MATLEMLAGLNRQGPPRSRRRSNRQIAWARVRRHPLMYLMLLPTIVYFLIFAYAPMVGVIIAFKRFDLFAGILHSPWVGLEHFQRFFHSVYFGRLLTNTFILNVYGTLLAFPLPIVMAMVLNEVRRERYKRVVQTATYLPYFVSTVVVATIAINILSPTDGIVNSLIKTLGGTPIAFLSRPEWFRHIYVWSDIWQSTGFRSIIYLAALAAIDPTLYESADIDGAGRLAKMWYISLPGIMPVAMVILLLWLGSLLSVGFEKVYLLYNPSTYQTADVISTYVYRAGLVAQQYDFGAAVGLFNSVLNLVLLTLFNWLAGRLKQQTLW